MDVLQPASRWERSQSGRLFAFEWSLSWTPLRRHRWEALYDT
jgi:hypothetical protein